MAIELCRGTGITRLQSKTEWPCVIDFENFKQYSKNVLASQIFPEQVIKKLNSQRPFGVDLSSEESKIAKERIHNLLPES